MTLVWRMWCFSHSSLSVSWHLKVKILYLWSGCYRHFNDLHLLLTSVLLIRTFGVRNDFSWWHEWCSRYVDWLEILIRCFLSWLNREYTLSSPHSSEHCLGLEFCLVMFRETYTESIWLPFSDWGLIWIYCEWSLLANVCWIEWFSAGKDFAPPCLPSLSAPQEGGRGTGRHLQWVDTCLVVTVECVYYGGMGLLWASSG